MLSIACPKCKQKFAVNQIYRMRTHRCQPKPPPNHTQTSSEPTEYPTFLTGVLNFQAEETEYYYTLSYKLKNQILTQQQSTPLPTPTIFKHNHLVKQFREHGDLFIRRYNNFIQYYYQITPEPQPPPQPQRQTRSSNTQKKKKLRKIPIQSETTTQSTPTTPIKKEIFKEQPPRPTKAQPNPRQDTTLTTNTFRDILGHLYNLNTDQSFYNYISNKSIAIVGPSRSVQGTKQAQKIHSYDLVVRLNKSLPVPTKMQEDVGYRTDILYNSMNQTDFPNENKLNSNLFRRCGVKYVCSPYPPIPPFDKDIITFIKINKEQLPFHFLNYATYKHTLAMLNGSRPYTGLAAIVDLLKAPIRELYVTGQDFYMTKYYSGYREMTNQSQNYTRNNQIHQVMPQINYLRYLALTDNRLKLDKVLDHILFASYHKIFQTFDAHHALYGDAHPFSETVISLSAEKELYLIKTSTELYLTTHPQLTPVLIQIKTQTTNPQTPSQHLLDITRLHTLTETSSSPTRDYYRKFMQLVSKINVNNVSYEMFAICYLLNNYRRPKLTLIGITQATFQKNYYEQYLFMYMQRQNLVSVSD